MTWWTCPACGWELRDETPVASIKPCCVLHVRRDAPQVVQLAVNACVPEAQ